MKAHTGGETTKSSVQVWSREHCIVSWRRGGGMTRLSQEIRTHGAPGPSLRCENPVLTTIRCLCLWWEPRPEATFTPSRCAVTVAARLQLYRSWTNLLARVSQKPHPKKRGRVQKTGQRLSSDCRSDCRRASSPHLTRPPIFPGGDHCSLVILESNLKQSLLY